MIEMLLRTFIGDSLVKSIRRWWKKRQLRKAQEQYAYWKAGREMLEKQLQSDWFFGNNPHNRHAAIEAAGKEAKFLERAEVLIRELNEGD